MPARQYLSISISSSSDPRLTPIRGFVAADPIPNIEKSSIYLFLFRFHSILALSPLAAKQYYLSRERPLREELVSGTAVTATSVTLEPLQTEAQRSNDHAGWRSAMTSEDTLLT